MAGSYESRMESLRSFGPDDPRTELLDDLDLTMTFDANDGLDEGRSLNAALTEIADFCERRAVELGY